VFPDSFASSPRLDPDRTTMSVAVPLKRLSPAKVGMRGLAVPTNTGGESHELKNFERKERNCIRRGGSIGAAVAKEFAAEGAEVFLAGRTQSRVEDVAKHVRAAGGHAQAATVDALDDAAVNAYLDRIVKQVGRIDAIFNATVLSPGNMETESTP
jgi:shikimate 5-dehydrogenase